MVTGPIPRNPKATSPNANTAGASIRVPRPVVLTPKAMAMSAIIASPNQNALKFPATKPDRMFREAPPSRDDVTISRTCRELVEVNTLTSSGMMAPASVPHVITSESFHHSVVSPPTAGINSRDATNVSATETSDVSQTSVVSGVSKFMWSTFWYRAFAKAAFKKYERPDAMTIMTRIAKIQTSSWTCTSGWWTASRMNEISATPVTPYVSNPSALGPTESPALSPVQSAMTPGLRASSSLILKTIFIRSAPMSAIFGEDTARDTERRRAEGLTNREADEAGTGVIARDEQQNQKHQEQLDADQQHPDAHAGFQWNRMVRVWFSGQARERGAGVRERVHPDAEPGYPVAAGDSDEAEQQNDEHLARRKAAHHGAGRVRRLRQRAEVQRHDRADKEPQNQQEPTLGEQIGLAGLVDQLGDLAHGAMHGEVAQLRVLRETKEQPQGADDQAPQQQCAAADPAEERGLVQVRQYERGFTACCMLGGILQQSENHAQRSPGCCWS